MAAENPNASMIAYLEAKIAAWQAALASLKSALALDPGGQPIEGLDLSSVVAQNGEIGQPVDLPDGAFHGKSVPTCIKLFLTAAKRKKTVKEIAVALREGGVESTAGNFENIVTTALRRLKMAGEVLRFKDGGWGLSSWYPANLRGTATPAQGKRSAKRKKGKKAKGSSSSPLAKAESSKVTEIAKIADIASPEDKPEVRILNFFKSNRREASANEIASTLGLKIQTTHLVLGKLVHQKKIERLSSGQFKALGAVMAG